MDEIYRKIVENDVQLNVCSLSKNYDFYDKISTSQSVISFGQILNSVLKSDENLKIAVKMFFHNDGLEYEMKMYRYILDQILYMRSSPNFISYIASGTCKVEDIIRLYEKPERDRVMAELQSFTKTEILPETQINVLAIEKAKKPLNAGEFFARVKSQIECNNVLFQIIHALFILGEKKCVHNDLHPGNILVSQLDDLVDLYYRVDGKIYKITTRYVVYLFDWDRSFSKSLGVNTELEGFYCDTFGTCNTFNPKRDLYTIIAKSIDSQNYIFRCFEPLIKFVRRQYVNFEMTEEIKKILTDNGINFFQNKISSECAKRIFSDYDEIFGNDFEQILITIDGPYITLGNRYYWLIETPPEIFPTPFEVLNHAGKWTEYIPTNLFNHLIVDDSLVPEHKIIY